MSNPYEMNFGTVSVEMARAAAEVQVKIAVARQFPRNMAQCAAEIRRVFGNPDFAEECFYRYERGGETIEGLSIRAAEELARIATNFESGVRELGRRENSTELQVYAWDVERNVTFTKNFSVEAVRETRSSRKALTSQRDIYEINANYGARRQRATILAALPAELVALAEQSAHRALAGHSVQGPQGGAAQAGLDAAKAQKLVAAFDALGVTAADLSERYGIVAITEMKPDQYADARSVYNTIRDDFGGAGKFFARLAPREAAQEAIEAFNGELSEEFAPTAKMVQDAIRGAKTLAELEQAGSLIAKTPSSCHGVLESMEADRRAELES